MGTRFNDRAGEWFNHLPDLLDHYSQLWSLTFLPPFPNLSYNYVAAVIRTDGTDAVLKAGIPHKELRTEIAALRAYDGMGIVRLLESDDEQCVFLLERLKPGAVLTELADEENDHRATSIAASVMRELWRPVPPEHIFPTVSDWAKGLQRLREHFRGGVGPFPKRIVEVAETLFTELLGSMSEPVLLHGDLHHDNILSAERHQWLAIDPKGIVGEPAYETGAMLRNLWPDRHRLSNPKSILKRRIDQLAEELNLSRTRIQNWALAQSVLSAWWCIEDEEDGWQYDIAIAELLDTIKV